MNDSQIARQAQYRPITDAIAKLGDKLADVSRGGELAVAKLIELLDEQGKAYGVLHDMLGEVERERDAARRQLADLREEALGLCTRVMASEPSHGWAERMRVRLFTEYGMEDPR